VAHCWSDNKRGLSPIRYLLSDLPFPRTLTACGSEIQNSKNEIHAIETLSDIKDKQSFLLDSLQRTCYNAHMITQLFERITDVAGGNQFLVGAISMWGLGVMTYLFRKIPSDIYALSKKHLTTSLTITSAHGSFYELMAWMESQGYSAKFRRVKLTNGRWGDDKLAKSVGMGRHLTWFQGIPVIIELTRMDTNSEKDKEAVTIIKLGRSHKLFDDLILELKKSDNRDDGMTKIYTRGLDGWSVSTQPPRDLDTVYIGRSNRDAIVRTLTEFRQKEDWFVEHGIPYQLGILLYGPPGTGKTSLIRAIAAHLGYMVRVVPASLLSKLRDAEDEKSKTIIVVEDIDSNTEVHDRDHEPKATNDVAKLMGGGISEILNMLDGIVVSHGRIVIMTTNHIEKLDPAIIRPGRIDLKLELSYVTAETFKDFAEKFFGERPNVGEPSGNVTVADLQNEVLLGRSLSEIIAKYFP